MTNQDMQHDEMTNVSVSVKPMQRSRVVLVFVLLAGLLAGHGYCVLVNQEFWPLSQYPMYSKRHWNMWTDELMVGVVGDDSGSEVEISEFAFDRPISVRMSIQKVNREMQNDPGKREQMRDILLGLGKKYEDQRGGNRPENYQEIDAIRLYLVTWQISEEDGEHRAREHRREIIMEVDLETGELQEGKEAA